MTLAQLSVVHLVGLALGLGAATTKTVLLLRCRADPDLVAAYLRVHRPISRVIIAGLILLVLSGVGFLVIGIPFTGRLGVKLALVAAILVLGPIIDNVAEPRYAKSAPAPGGAVSVEFVQARTRYLALEVTATLLFYVVTAYWLLA